MRRRREAYRNLHGREALRNWLSEKDGDGPPVDLRLKVGEQDYAIEHTLLQPREDRITDSAAFRKINEFIRKEIREPLPGPVYYELHVPIHVTLPNGNKNRDRAFANLAEWIRSTAQQLHERRREFPPSFFVNNTIKEAPDGFRDEFELLRWPEWAPATKRTPGVLGMKFMASEDFEDLLANALTNRIAKKLPKLHRCKAQGARTVLVLEGIDLPIGHYQIIGKHLPALLERHSGQPDEVYLVEPRVYETTWWIWPVKRDGEHWPEVGLPENGRPYFPLGQRPAEEMAQWHRQLYGPIEPYAGWPLMPLEWSPAFFTEKQLDDLTQSRAGGADDSMGVRQGPPSVKKLGTIAGLLYTWIKSCAFILRSKRPPR